MHEVLQYDEFRSYVREQKIFKWQEKWSFPNQPVNFIIRTLQTGISVNITGESGVGKSFFCKNALPEILSEGTGRPYRLLYLEPHRFTRTEELTEVLYFDRRLIYVPSEHLQMIEHNLKEGAATLIVIDELSRNDYRAQNIIQPFFDIGSKTIPLPHHAEPFEMPADTRLVSIGNPSTYLGTFNLIDSINDRVDSIEWPYPTRELAIIQMMDVDIGFVPFKHDINGRKLSCRKFSKHMATALVNAIWPFNDLPARNLSIRDLAKMKKDIVVLEDPDVIIHAIMEKLSRKIQKQNSELKASLYEIQDRLEDTLKRVLQ